VKLPQAYTHAGVVARALEEPCVASVEWIPEDRMPPDAAELERLMDEAVPQCEVRLRWDSEGWRVRALAPQVRCGRGRSFEDRDVSARIVEILEDAGQLVHRS
jgi:hypothetical protein